MGRRMWNWGQVLGSMSWWIDPPYEWTSKWRQQPVAFPRSPTWPICWPGHAELPVRDPVTTQLRLGRVLPRTCSGWRSSWLRQPAPAGSEQQHEGPGAYGVGQNGLRPPRRRQVRTNHGARQSERPPPSLRLRAGGPRWSPARGRAEPGAQPPGPGQRRAPVSVAGCRDRHPGRLGPALVAGVFYALLLHFFFTGPFHTLHIHEASDVVAVMVFAAVAVMLSWVADVAARRASAVREAAELQAGNSDGPASCRVRDHQHVLEHQCGRATSGA